MGTQFEFRTLRVSARALAMVCLLCAPAVAATHSVPAGGDLQAALDAAEPGDLILLAAGATYSGNFTLPLKQGTAFVTIRTDAAARDLPAAGSRVSPAHAASLAKIKSPNTEPALTTADGAHHWRIEAVEFGPTANGSGDIIVLGSAAYTQTSQMPHNIVLDRVYIHGDPSAGQKRGIALQSGYTEILNSYISDIKSAGQDSQAICGWNGTGPYLIENNYLEASGENVMFGGADPAVWNLVPADITLRGNVLSKPLSWRQEKWSVKNVFELKNARRVLVEGNVMENVWRSGQSGFAVQLTPRNQSGTAPWSVVEDVTMRYNVIRHAGGAINMLGWDDEKPSAQMRRVRITENVVYDIDASWGGPGTGMFLQIGNSPADIVVDHNTVLNSGNVVNVYGTRNGGPWIVDGFVYRDNLSRHNSYGVIGDNQGIGQATLAVFFTDLVFDHNVLAGGEASQYPAGNYFPSVGDFDAAFANKANEDFTLVPGSPFRILASDGGPVGADAAAVTAAVRGTAPPSQLPASSAPAPPPSTSTGREATCRPGSSCEAGNPPARARH